MRVSVYSEKGIKMESKLDLPGEIFEVKPNEVALREYIHNYQINQRRGTVATKTRGEVSGGGRKPWAQKGTGRARQGSIRAPQWVGGGIVHGPQPRGFSAHLPKNICNLALRSALSERAASGKVFVVGEFAPKEPKTSLAAQLLHKLGAIRPLVVMPEKDEKIIRSFRNIKGVSLGTVATLNPYEVVKAGSVVLLKESVGRIKERLGKISENKSSGKKIPAENTVKKVSTKKTVVKKMVVKSKPKVSRTLARRKTR